MRVYLVRAGYSPCSRLAFGVLAAVLVLPFQSHAAYGIFTLKHLQAQQSQKDSPKEHEKQVPPSETATSPSQCQQYWLDPKISPGALPCVVNFRALNLTNTPIYECATQDAPQGVDAALVIADHYTGLGIGPDAWLMDVDSENMRRGWSSFQGCFVRPALLRLSIKARDIALSQRGAQMDAQNRRLNYETQERVMRVSQHERGMASLERKFSWQEDSAARSDPAHEESHSANAEEHRQEAERHDTNADAADKSRADLQTQNRQNFQTSTQSSGSPRVNTSSPSISVSFSTTELRVIEWCARYFSATEIQTYLGQLTDGQRAQLRKVSPSR